MFQENINLQPGDKIRYNGNSSTAYESHSPLADNLVAQEEYVVSQVNRNELETRYSLEGLDGSYPTDWFELI